MNSSAATAAEIVSAIQREALLHAGLPPLPAPLQSYAAEVARFKALLGGVSKEGSSDESPFEKYRDLGGLLARIPTVYQNPFIYAWLEDFWNLHSKAVYREASHPQPAFLMASAATGQFNAKAIVADDQPAILLEDGLIFFAHSAAHILSALLYEKIEGNRYRTREVFKSPTPTSPQYLACVELAGLILDYLLKGAVPGVHPMPLTEEEDFSIRHVIFTSFISFVFEHELHHLREARESGSGLSTRKRVVQERFEALWRFVQLAFKDETRIEFDRPVMEMIFHAHSEEHFADLRALMTVIHLGRENKTLLPSVDGALLFFFLAEAIDHAQRGIADSAAYKAMNGMNDVALILNGLVLEESHPYPQLRLKGVLETQEAFHPSLKILLHEEAETIKAIFETVKVLLSQTIEARQLQIQHIHPKWTFHVEGSLL